MYANNDKRPGEKCERCLYDKTLGKYSRCFRLCLLFCTIVFGDGMKTCYVFFFPLQVFFFFFPSGADTVIRLPVLWDLLQRDVKSRISALRTILESGWSKYLVKNYLDSGSTDRDETISEKKKLKWHVYNIAKYPFILLLVKMCHLFIRRSYAVTL